jgi:hypothetical protein
MRWTIAVLAALLLASPAGAQVAATVAKITGKAQVLKGADWTPLAVGQKLEPGDTVSTGFRSELQLSIGASVVTVKALSRLTLKTLTQNGTDLQTDLYLKVGKVDAEVNKSETVATQTFKVSSPVATASVRGTAFSFDTLNLRVTRGLVDFSDLSGALVSVPVGESARAAVPGTNQRLTSNAAIVTQNAAVKARTSTDFGQAAAGNSASWSVQYASYEDFLNSLWYDWYGEPGDTHLYIGGIRPDTIPAAVHISIGGISP